MTIKEVRSKVIKKMKNTTGYNSRQVSVKFSGVSGINFMIKDENVSIETIQKFANGYEKIDRCHVSGEVLQGGNTFVFVEYSENVQRFFIEKYKTCLR